MTYTLGADSAPGVSIPGASISNILDTGLDIMSSVADIYIRIQQLKNVKASAKSAQEAAQAETEITRLAAIAKKAKAESAGVNRRGLDSITKYIAIGGAALLALLSLK